MSLVHEKVRPKAKSYFVFGLKPFDKVVEERHENQRQQCEYPDNVKNLPIRLVNHYATHHSKVMVLFTTDNSGQEFAEVVIHTANLIPFDWTNMTQGVWRSGKLPALKKGGGQDQDAPFLKDFRAYLHKYRTGDVYKLATKLKSFDFSSVRATLVASVPGNFKPGDSDYEQWGINRMRAEVAKLGDPPSPKDTVVCQMSSVATLGKKDSYLSPVLLNGFLGREFHKSAGADAPQLKIIFPSLRNVQESLNGYDSGTAIHYKDEPDQQAYIRPLLCQWVGEKSGRDRAAPHIKTYMHVDGETGDLNWVLLTSANLSKQAWGTVNKTAKNQYIQSWECGVMVHRGMFGASTRLVPSYKADILGDSSSSSSSHDQIPIRMPFDLPVTPYSHGDEPWYQLRSHSEPDWLGEKWEL